MNGCENFHILRPKSNEVQSRENKKKRRFSKLLQNMSPSVKIYTLYQTAPKERFSILESVTGYIFYPNCCRVTCSRVPFKRGIKKNFFPVVS